MDPTQRKKALRLLTYGLYVVTARDEQRYAAGTVTWLSQCSLQPPLVMCGVQRKSALHRAITDSKAFAVHVVGRSQKKLATTFFKTATWQDDRLSGYQFRIGKTGAPLLAEAAAWFECRVIDVVTHGDHTVFIAQVVEAGTNGDDLPLVLRDAGFSYGG